MLSSPTGNAVAQHNQPWCRRAPPCQGMSSARGSRGHESDADAGSRDARNLLVEVIADVAKKVEPRIVVVENVPAFLSRLVIDPDTREPISAAALLIRLLGERYRVVSVPGKPGRLRGPPAPGPRLPHVHQARRARARTLGTSSLGPLPMCFRPPPILRTDDAPRGPSGIGRQAARCEVPHGRAGRLQPHARRARLGQQSPVSDGCRDSARFRRPSMAELAVRAMRGGRSRLRGRCLPRLCGTTVAPSRPGGGRVIQAREGL